MKALVLAAGYGTRLYPLTRDRPKPLLPIGGRPLLDRLVENLGRVEQLEAIWTVTNGRFEGDFRSWAERVRRRLPVPLHVISDGTTEPEERLGAVGDIAYAIERAEPEDDLLVAAGDNLFEFEIQAMVRAAQGDPRADAVVAVEERRSRDRLRRGGVAEVDDEGRIRRFVEKPEEPGSRTAAAPLHLYRRRTLPLVRRYVESGGEADAPGHFLEWLVPRRPVRAWRMPADRHDIGTPESFRETRRRFRDDAGGRGGGDRTDGWP